MTTMTTNTYKVSGLFGRYTPFTYTLGEDALTELRKDVRYRIDSVEAYTPTIRYKVDPTCERCTTDEYVPHYNCMYHGNAMGHSAAHCTASACY